MFKYLLVVLVLVSYEILRCAFAQDTSTHVLTIPNADSRNWTAITEELSKKPVIAMDGNNNYNVAQQIFYIYNEQQLKKILINNRYSEKMGSTGLTKHKLVTRKVIWNTARQTCSKEGGYLAIINSEAEEQLLLRLMQDNKISEAWLGVHDLYQEGEWVTVNGEPLEETGYNKWTTKFELQQPDGGYQQNCARLVAGGGMDDIQCHDAYAFFCEMAA